MSTCKHDKEKNRCDVLCKEITTKGKASIDCDKPVITEIIDSFVKCIVEEYKVVEGCSGCKLIVKGCLCIKIHYCSDCECGLVLSTTITEPFCEVIDLGCELMDVCDVCTCVKYSDVDLIECHDIYYLALICMDIKVKYCECHYTEEKGEEILDKNFHIYPKREEWGDDISSTRYEAVNYNKNQEILEVMNHHYVPRDIIMQDDIMQDVMPQRRPQANESGYNTIPPSPMKKKKKIFYYGRTN